MSVKKSAALLDINSIHIFDNVDLGKSAVDDLNSRCQHLKKSSIMLIDIDILSWSSRPNPEDQINRKPDE